MARRPSTVSLAAWLHSYGPDTPLDHFEHTLDADHHLARALERIAQLVAHEGTEERIGEAQAAQGKVATLRTSLSHLTAHLSTLTDRLASSSSALAALHLAHDRAHSTHAQQLGAVQALCGVWEARWKEERRGREEAEGELARERMAEGRGKSLNDRARRRETELRVSTRPSHTHRRSSSSSAASSAGPARPSRTRRTSPTKKPRPSKRGLIAQLSAQLRRVEEETRSALQEKEDEITRLKADQQARRDEAQQLYRSLDTLLALGGPPAAQNVPLPPSTAEEAEQLATSQRTHLRRLSLSTLPHIHSINTTTSSTRAPAPAPPSLLDHPSLAAAARHSRSREAQYKDISTGGLPDEVQETLALEDEVRELEREIARLNHDPASDPAQPALSVRAEADLPSDERHALLQKTIDDLSAQVEQLSVALRETREERGALQRVCDEYRTAGAAEAQPDEALLARIAQLEDENKRLSHLLQTTESESSTLAAELSATHSSIDALSARVRRKLEEQRAKLDAARAEVGRLRAECEAWRERCIEVEGALERERDRRRREGRREGGGTSSSID
ncbi:hypothetical protein JCM10207_008784 [Rhodosporidiobolus poonsookiae]